MDDPEEIRAFMQANSFAILVSLQENVPVASHIPLLLEKNSAGKDVLVGHIARGNPQKHSLKNDTRVLVIFNGPHSYVSSSWYLETHVPTWNYLAVHVYGKIRIMEGEELRKAVTRLTSFFEGSRPNAVSVDKLPEEYVISHLRGIVGFEISIEEIQAKAKLSQNRTEEDFARVITQLEKSDVSESRAVAEEMKKRKPLV